MYNFREISIEGNRIKSEDLVICGQKIIKETHREGSVFYMNEKREYHNPNGPAVLFMNTGYKAWYINGKRHREDGPAKENCFTNVSGVEYYLNDKEYTKEEWEREILNRRLKRILDL